MEEILQKLQFAYDIVLITPISAIGQDSVNEIQGYLKEIGLTNHIGITRLTRNTYHPAYNMRVNKKAIQLVLSVYASWVDNTDR